MENVLEYENLIYKMINNYKSFDKEDLYQVAMMGLMKASKNYDKTQDTKFSTYAYYYILGEINNYISTCNSMKISKDILRLNKSLEQAKEAMSQRLNREPSMEELSVFLEVPIEKIEEATIATRQVESLDYTYDEESNLYNNIGREEQAMSDKILDLKEAINSLTPEERQLILARYYNGMTQQETSQSMGMSQVQVSRKESKILQKLKTTL